jgi:hypothetical protein
LYRWHATTSAEDEEWIKLQFKALFLDKEQDDITLKDFYSKEAELTEKEQDLQQWTFGCKKSWYLPLVLLFLFLAALNAGQKVLTMDYLRIPILPVGSRAR